jgi:hypothetical protein
MANPVPRRTICWRPLWNQRRAGLGLEQLLLAQRSANGTVLAFDEEGRPFSLRYQLEWDGAFNLRSADLAVEAGGDSHTLLLRTDGAGRWFDGTGKELLHLEGCRDIDIWPTPFTNSFAWWRVPLAIGERREFRMAWVSAPGLTVQPQAQAYTRVSARQYRFENLDSGFRAELSTDADGLVIDYPGFFERVPD